MSTYPPPTEMHRDANGPLSAAEERRLEAAMRKADQIMVASLKDDERRRLARRRRTMLLLLSGGLIMIAAGVVIFLSLLASGQPSEQDIAKASDLSGDGWQLWQQRDLGAAEA